MTPEQKTKLIKLLIGALIAGAVAAMGYLTTNIGQVFSAIPFGVAAGVVAGAIARL